jgi:hypothetical protein
VVKAIRFCETGDRRSCSRRKSRSAIPAAARSTCVLTRPVPADYLGERAEPAEELFSRAAAGKLTIEINQRYPPEDAVQGHRDLEPTSASARRSSTSDHKFDVRSETPTRMPHDDD